ncbi:MAG: PhzF family phenazine biosynthesis protein [Bacteroides sp.]|nr:PhzF family phenazine biosynthesis protein [Bacteroides sp.]
MKQKIYQVDAFANEAFRGNPASVCPLDKWLKDETLLKIAMENNLAETAFYVKNERQYEIRWFTPTIEVDLCGHATLAAAFILFNYEGRKSDTIYFHSPRSGELTVTRHEPYLTLNFPVDVFEEIELTDELSVGFNLKPRLAFKGKTDYLFIYNNEEEIKTIKYDLEAISRLKARGVIISAKGNKTDFVSRFFAPQSGINEDPVTGSAHTTLIPYWSEVLGKKELTAMQLSKRTGYLRCKNLGNRVEISGECTLYMLGEIHLPII